MDDEFFIDLRRMQIYLEHLLEGKYVKYADESYKEHIAYTYAQSANEVLKAACAVPIILEKTQND